MFIICKIDRGFGNEINLRLISKLRKEFDCVVGYSGHEVGLSPTWAAVVQGAAFVERHITLDRAMWGSDHSASVEPKGLMRLAVPVIRRNFERMLVDRLQGIKRALESREEGPAHLGSSV